MKDNLHFIVEEDGRSLVVENGVVSQHSQPHPLRNTPDGWRNIVINWERQLARYGLQRSFTTPLGYVNDGATILRDAVYNQSYERRLFHLIHQLSPEVDNTFFRLIYRYLYKGELDLSTFKDEDTKVTCGIMEGGVSKLLKANEGTTYEVPFDSDAINVKMDGTLLFQKSNWSITPMQVRGNGETGWNDFQALNFAFISKEGTSGGIVTLSQDNEQIDTSLTALEYMQGSDNYFVSNKGDATVNFHIKGKLKFTCTQRTNVSGSSKYSAWIGKSDGTTYSIFNEAVLVEGGVFEQDFEFTIPLAVGEKLFLLSFFDKAAVNIVRIRYEETDLVVADYSDKKGITYIKAFKPYDLFRKLIERITGRATDASSQLLQDESNILITCGDAIRGIEGAKIKITFNQFFEHCAVAHFAGLGIENGKIVIEKRDRFFNQTSPVHLGKAKGLTRSLANDIISNTVKIGWQDPDVEDVNGKYSFNGSHLYSTLITRVVKESTNVSSISADPYEIEIIRINLEVKSTTDSSSDNKNYALDVDLSAPATVVDIGTVYPLFREAYDTLEGVPTDTVFNVRLSPKRLLAKHGPWISSLLWPFDQSSLKFESTQRNSLLKTVKAGVTVQENANKPVYELLPRLFLPIYFEFETEIPATLISIMETNPNQAFTFEWDGEIYGGFPMKISQSVNTDASQQIKLLAFPDTNLSKLVA
jgi:hypothetical protein